jgi:hypothetical protein
MTVCHPEERGDEGSLSSLYDLLPPRFFVFFPAVRANR